MCSIFCFLSACFFFILYFWDTCPTKKIIKINEHGQCPIYCDRIRFYLQCGRMGDRKAPEIDTNCRECTCAMGDVRFMIMRHFMVHMTKPNRLKGSLSFDGRLVNDFEASYDRSPTAFPLLSDEEIIESGSVIIIIRKPVYVDKHFVPRGCIDSWCKWLKVQNEIRKIRNQPAILESYFQVEPSLNC